MALEASIFAAFQSWGMPGGIVCPSSAYCYTVLTRGWVSIVRTKASSQSLPLPSDRKPEVSPFSPRFRRRSGSFEPPDSGCGDSSAVGRYDRQRDPPIGDFVQIHSPLDVMNLVVFQASNHLRHLRGCRVAIVCDDR